MKQTTCTVVLYVAVCFWLQDNIEPFELITLFAVLRHMSLAQAAKLGCDLENAFTLKYPIWESTLEYIQLVISYAIPSGLWSIEGMTFSPHPASYQWMLSWLSICQLVSQVWTWCVEVCTVPSHGVEHLFSPRMLCSTGQALHHVCRHFSKSVLECRAAWAQH